MSDSDQTGYRDSALAREGRDIGWRAWAYLRTRRAEHWLIFAAGVIIGLIVS